MSFDWDEYESYGQVDGLVGRECLLEVIAYGRALEAERDALRKDAARYQWLAERFTGYDFNWMPSSEDVMDGKSCAVFNVGEDFKGGRDITAAIDAAIAAKEPK